MTETLKNEPSLDAAIESLRYFFGSKGRSPHQSNLATAQIVTWICLSALGKLPSEWTVRHFRNISAHSGHVTLEKVERFFASATEPLWQIAFDGFQKNVQGFEQDFSVWHLIDSTYVTLSQEAVDWTNVAESLIVDEYTSIPKEVSQLVVKLLDLKASEQVYTAFHSSLRAAIESAKTNKTFLETELKDSLFACLDILSANLHLQFADPIFSPSFIEDGRLKQFDKSAAITRFSAKKELPSFDVFNRFSEKASYSDSSDIQHLLAQTANRAVVVVANNVLFRTTSSERDFKKRLIDAGWLQSVIALPSGLLAGSGIQLNVLVIDKTAANEEVLFIDASTHSFVEARRERRLSRNRLTNIKEILELVELRTTTTKSRFITRKECEESDYDLLVSKFFLSIEQENIEVTLAKSKTTPLSDLATIIRGQAVKPGTEPTRYQYCEVGARDIWGSGLITAPPEKYVYVDSKEAYSDSFQSLILEPGDLVLAVKGSVGIVGLVPTGTRMLADKVPFIQMEDMIDVSESEGLIASPLNWIVGQSYVIVRPHKEIVDKMTRKKTPGMAPEVLLMYLMSALAQTWMKSKAAGSTVPLLKTQYIQALPVIVPSLENQELIKQRHEKLCKIEDEKVQLEFEASELRDEPWPTEWIKD